MPLVLTFDGKGIVMLPDALRPATAKAAASAEGKLATRLSPGEKNGRKRMAELACVYDAVPVPRTPEDIISTPAQKRRKKKAQAGKAEGQGKAAGAAGAGQVADRLGHRRHPRRHRRRLRRGRAPRPAAQARMGRPHRRQQHADRGRHRRGRPPRHHGHDRHRLHPRARIPAGRPPGPSSTRASPPPRNGSLTRPARSCTAKPRQVAAGIRRRATTYGYSPAERAGADECARYLDNKKDYLDYATALRKGWPIATGIIEGACRHIVKDRMDITGARWGLEGAEAILKLRAVIASGDFDDYWRLCRYRHRGHYAA